MSGNNDDNDNQSYNDDEDVVAYGVNVDVVKGLEACAARNCCLR